MPQAIEFWPLKSLSEVSGVHRDSISQSGNCLGSVSVHSLTLPHIFLHSRGVCDVTPGLPLSPHPCGLFALAPELPLGPQPCNPFSLVASPKLGLRQCYTICNKKPWHWLRKYIQVFFIRVLLSYFQHAKWVFYNIPRPQQRCLLYNAFSIVWHTLPTCLWETIYTHGSNG
jgi:hypothetical protein